jgi:hypothetical protein
MRTGGATRRHGRSIARAEWEAAAVEVLAGLWRFRLELLLAAVAILGQQLLARPLGGIVAGLLVVLLAVAALAVGPARRLLFRRLRLAALRRAWEPQRVMRA